MPSYGLEQLATLSRAYPGLALIFDHAEQRERHAGRFVCNNGRMRCPGPSQMAKIFETAAFQQLVARSG